MVNIYYADKFNRPRLVATYSPADTLRFLTNLQYSPLFIYVRESGITIIG